MYIKDYDTFLSQSLVLNEGLTDNGKIIKRGFIKRGPKMVKGELVDPAVVISTVEEAIHDLSFNFGSFFNFVKNFTIIYFWFDKKCKTMCVDDHMNIYISVPFVKFGLKMDKRLIGAVVMHEILHVAFNHLDRGKRWLVSKNKPLDRDTAHDNNLAADIEVNIALLKKNVIALDELTNKIKGLYLREFAGTVPPMETILEDKNAMEKLREMSPLEDDNDDDDDDDREIETTKEFDEAYVKMKNKITEIVNKYGPETALKKLREIGAIDGVNANISDDINFDDVFALSFLVIKSFDEFINESNENGQNPMSTAEDGYREAIKKALGEIQSALNDDDDDNTIVDPVPGGPEGPNGPKIKSGIKDSDLKPMNLPGKNKKGRKQKSDGGLPTNVRRNGKDDEKREEGPEGPDNQKNSKDQNNQNNSKEQKPGNGNGGGGNVDLRGAIKDGGVDNDINISYNGSKTGSFTDSGSEMAKSMKETLKNDYGEDFKDIDKIIKSNIENNTKERIEKRKQEAFSRLSKDDSLRKIWEEGKKSEEKYKSLWKKILKRFLAKNTRRAGLDVEDKNMKWYDVRRMSVTQIAPQTLKKAQDVQDINVYVDVSGSVYSNMELMKLIAQSLVAFLVEYKYSGINVIPWASTSTGIHRVDPISKIGKEKAVEQIIEYIQTGASECGGGTSLRDACVPQIVATTFQYEKRQKKDDVHIIITDGYTSPDEEGIEGYVESAINSYMKTGSSSLSKKVVKNCIWFLYDNDSEVWKNNIMNGELVMISSQNFIPTE